MTQVEATVQVNDAGRDGAESASGTAAVAVPGTGLLRPTLWLWKREVVRFYRQPGRVIGALATPVVFWLLLGAGLNRSFVQSGGAAGLPGVGYLEYFFPGSVVLMIMFTAIFSTISVIEDRREGFLQGVLVSPAPRMAIVLGKVLGGATLATLQALLLLAIWPFVSPWAGWEAAFRAIAGAMGVATLASLALTALGLCVAWPMESTSSFHSVMNLFLMPMWFLSGAVFPVRSAPLAMKVVMALNPLTYTQGAFSRVLTGGRIDPGPDVSMALSLAVTLVFTLVTVLLAAGLVSRPRKDGLA